MRTFYSSCLLVLLFFSGTTASAESRFIAIEDVAPLLSAQNFSVLANAERVYQAKDSIQVARGNLLPKLNLWRIVGVAVDVKGVVGLIGDIVPFLVPANWWQVKQAKLFASAQREAYYALWANEVMTAKALYYHAELDRNLLLLVQTKITELNELKTIARSREVLGGTPESLSKQIAVQILALEEDVRALEYLVAEELNTLGYSLGLPSETDLVLKPIDPSLVHFRETRAKAELSERAASVSPESRQYSALIEASRYAKKQARFTFLGVSSLSRGIMGGVFDSLPISDGLGFGTAASIRVTKREKAFLELQKRGIEESLKRTVSITFIGLNFDSESLIGSAKRKELSRSVKNDLDDRLRLGESVDTFELLNAVKASTDAEVEDLVIRFRMLTSLDRLKRLCFEDDYSRLPQVGP